MLSILSNIPQVSVLGIMHPLRKQRANLNIYMAGYLLVTCFNVWFGLCDVQVG
jgi:hypothetical protein